MIEDILKPLWEIMKNENYVILRNYETMLSDICCGGDIDILCESREKIVTLLHAKPVRNDIDVYNYRFYIGEQRIAMDIREIGDDYYVSKWEEEMLRKRVKYKNFYVLESEDYIYSLLYHALIHKSSVADKYKEFFRKKLNTANEIELLEKLKWYMNENGYKPTLPLDKFVDFNKSNFMTLTSGS